MNPPHRGHQATWGGFYSRNGQTCSSLTGRTSGLPHQLRTWSALPAPQQNQQKCFSRLSPSERLDQLVWEDLSALLTEPEQVTQALERAHGGAWLPQELQARQESLRRGQASLVQQLDRLTEAYLAGVVLLEEYRRRRSDLERRCQALAEQQRQLIAPVDRREE